MISIEMIRLVCAFDYVFCCSLVLFLFVALYVSSFFGVRVVVVVAVWQCSLFVSVEIVFVFC